MMTENRDIKATALSVVIQAGGKSIRMGENKALMFLSGKPLIQRVLERVKPIAQELFIVTNDTPSFAFLGEKMVNDSIPNMGAIGGLYTAMDVSSNHYVAVVACDLPFVSTAILQKGLELLMQSDADVAIPMTGPSFYEPLHAVYRRDTCKEAIYQSIVLDQRRLVSWLPRVKVIELRPALYREFDPNDLAFYNINTKDDFLKAEQIIEKSLK
jgi:molybdopterin-guanine dinucleotide biosynthesis protein A